MLPIEINTIEEYNYTVGRDYEPLIDWPNFVVDTPLRIDLQRKIFGKSLIGKGNIPQANQRFYIWVWDRKKHYCEECAKPLLEYSSVFISHIISKGARSDIAHDPRNVNILCFKHHDQWETGNRAKMNIYKKNIKIIELLKKDYQ